MLALFFAFSSLALAQTPTMTIRYNYDGEQPIRRDGVSYDDGLDVLLEYLRSKRDGQFQMGQGEQVILEIKVTGEQVQLTTAKGTQTTTLDAVLANFESARAAGHLAACKVNLQTMATALKAWGADHDGHFPDNLALLVPTYLTQVPSCTARSGYDTYGAGYKQRQAPDHFVLQCTVNHTAAGVGHGIPAYDSDFGLIESESDLRQRFHP